MVGEVATSWLLAFAKLPGFRVAVEVEGGVRDFNHKMQVPCRGIAPELRESKS